MDPSPKSYPVVNFVLSRLTSLRSKSDSPESGFDIEQPPPPSESDEAPFVDPLVEQMPYLKDPKVIAEMSKVVTEISQTRSVLEALGDRPDHETVDKAKEKMAEIDSKLALQLEEMALRQRPSEVSLDDWESHLADKKEERREAAEKEKALYRSIIQLEDMHLEYAKLLKDAEKRLMKIYEVAASRAVDRAGKGVVEDEDGVDEGPSEEVNDDVVGILRKNASGGDVNRVDLSGKRLRFLPEAFGKIRGLVVLNLSNNQLQAIPDSVAGLESLEELNISSNLLESLPDSIGLLTNLKILNVSGNKLNALPDSICYCRSLEELDASFNNLAYLPTNIGTEMILLKRLSVQYNKLPGLPTSIGGMKSLQQLDIHFNELRGLPTTIGSLTNLESLNLSGNFSDLQELPETLGELINLKELDISNNQIHQLPDSFGRLENLTKLNLEQNPIELPPPEILSQGVEAIKDFMAQRWVELLVEEEAKSVQSVKEESESRWSLSGVARSTSWLKEKVSSVSAYLGASVNGYRDPWLNQQL
ncbi:uncharacterized protein [Phyllobates terribilis]|uniref:uncharacterized protein n=1 Tax=Phyllobates terribilis TaxID=111132 RepID=UPI003CCAAECC